MKWKSSKDVLPEDQEELLIKVGGVCHLAVFNSSTRIFRLKTGENIKVSQFVVQWTRLVKT
jgi:hypothetical protein